MAEPIDITKYLNDETGTPGMSRKQIEKIIRDRNPFAEDAVVEKEIEKILSRESSIKRNERLFNDLV